MRKPHAFINGQLLLFGILFCVNPICWGQGRIFWAGQVSDHIYSMRPDDAQPTPFFEGHLGAVSPNGKLLLVWVEDLAPNFGVLDAETGQMRHVIELVPRVFGGGFAWSPDGRWIAYTGVEEEDPRGRVETVEIYTFRPDGSQFQRLTFSGGRKVSPVWHPNGRSLFYLNRSEPDDDAWEIAMHAPDRPQRQQWFHEGAGFMSRWPFFSISPSGKEIAYCCLEGLYVVNVDGTNRRRVTPDGFDRPFQVDWSLNGRQLVFATMGFPDEIWGLHILSLDSGQIRHLLSTDDYLWHPTWVPDPLTVESTGKLVTTWGAIKALSTF